MSPSFVRTSLSPLQIPHRESRRPLRGMTLLELTVVILVLLSLITILFIGARSWKRGSDRTICIINLQNVQKGVRSYANLYGFTEGAPAPDLKNKIIGIGRFVESVPTCPAMGTYTFGETYGPDTIPPIGELYMRCGLETLEQHAPANHQDW